MIAVPINRISKSLLTFVELSLMINGVRKKFAAIPNCDENKLKPEINEISCLGNQTSANFDGKYERKIWKTAHNTCPINT